jgi:glutaredoxin
MKKDTKIYLGLVVIVILIIISIVFIRNSGEVKLNEELAKCISSKSILIASKTCSHCATQKEILGKYISNFNISYTDEDSTLWSKYNLIRVPTWVINNKNYPGVKTIKELKVLTNC